MKKIKRILLTIKMLFLLRVNVSLIIYRDVLPKVLRYCGACGKYKPEEQFEKGTSFKDKFHPVCNKCRSDNPKAMINCIFNVVSDNTGIEVDDIKKETRKREIVEARMQVILFLKEFTDLSLSGIGSKVGGKDHATVLHGIKTINNLCDTNKALKSQIDYSRSVIINKTRKYRSVKLKIAN